MLRRLATYPIAVVAATVYAVVNTSFGVHGAADVALFALCGFMGAAVAVPLALSAPPRHHRRQRAPGAT